MRIAVTWIALGTILAMITRYVFVSEMPHEIIPVKELAPSSTAPPRSPDEQVRSDTVGHTDEPTPARPLPDEIVATLFAPDSSQQLRKAAIAQLAEVLAEGVSEAVLADLQAQNEEVLFPFLSADETTSLEVLKIIGALKRPSSVKHLLPLLLENDLNSPNYLRRAAVVKAIAEIGVADAETLTILESRLDDPRMLVAEAAIHAIPQLDRDAGVRVLKTALGEFRRTPSQAAALDVLERTSDVALISEVEDELVRLLQPPKPGESKDIWLELSSRANRVLERLKAADSL